MGHTYKQEINFLSTFMIKTKTDFEIIFVISTRIMKLVQGLHNVDVNLLRPTIEVNLPRPASIFNKIIASQELN